MDSQWEAIKRIQSAITDSFAPNHRIERTKLPPWWRRRITGGRKRKHKAFMRNENTQDYGDYLRYRAERKRMSRIRRWYRITYEKRITRSANSNPKACNNHVQSKAALRKTVDGVKNHQGNSLTGSQEKAVCWHFSMKYAGGIKGRGGKH